MRQLANAEPVPLAALRTAVTKVRADFQNARYDRMAASLPALIATATATRDQADGHERATTSALLADAYITAASFMVKPNDHPLAWTTADRALQAAQAGDDPLTLAGPAGRSRPWGLNGLAESTELLVSARDQCGEDHGRARGPSGGTPAVVRRKGRESRVGEWIMSGEGSAVLRPQSRGSGVSAEKLVTSLRLIVTAAAVSTRAARMSPSVLRAITSAPASSADTSWCACARRRRTPRTRRNS